MSVNLAELILSACAQRDWKLSDLAREMGVARTQTFNWAQGKLPCKRHLERLADVIGVPFGELVQVAAADRYR